MTFTNYAADVSASSAETTANYEKLKYPTVLKKIAAEFNAVKKNTPSLQGIDMRLAFVAIARNAINELPKDAQEQCMIEVNGNSSMFLNEEDRKLANDTHDKAEKSAVATTPAIIEVYRHDDPYRHPSLHSDSLGNQVYYGGAWHDGDPYDGVFD